MNELEYFADVGHSPRYLQWQRILGDNPEKKIKPLSQMFAERVTGKTNKDVLFMLVGERGSGKSYSLLRIAINTAMEIAKIKDGDTGKWQKYFGLQNVSVIQEEDLEERMMNLTKHNVYVLDDAGVGWDSRDFATKTNKRLNHIVQVCRTANTVLLISVPDPFLIDKVPRSLVRYYGEVSEQIHEYGISLLKVFQNVRLFREGKTLTMHMPWGYKTTARRFIVTAPPKEMADEYEKIRDQKAREVARTDHVEELQIPKTLNEKHCDRCGYTYTPRVPHPKMCPQCQAKFTKVSRKRIISTQDDHNVPVKV
jgi:predicted Zn-ribbon and HTH transcriptional regulator